MNRRENVRTLMLGVLVGAGLFAILGAGDNGGEQSPPTQVILPAKFSGFPLSNSAYVVLNGETGTSKVFQYSPTGQVKEAGTAAY